MPALAFVGVASGSVARSVTSPVSRRIHFVPGAAERVAVDHVAEQVDDVAADEGAGRDDQEADDRRARSGSSGRSASAGPQDERDEQEHERDDHERRVRRRPDAGRAVGVGVVGRAGHGGREHEQDRRDERDVRRRGLAERCRGRPSAGAPRSGCRSRRHGGGGRATSPLRKSLIGRIGRNRALSQRWLKSPSGRAQPSWAATSRASRRRHAVPPRRVYPQTVHIGGKFGDNFRPDSLQVRGQARCGAMGPAPYISSCPKGQVEPPDRFEE